jgi:hypothetical protein
MSAEIRRLLEKCHEFAVGVNIDGHGEEFWEDVRGKLCDELDDFLTAAPAAPQEERQRRACSCVEPDPVMQADRKFYCHRCSFETGARPAMLEP